MSLLLLVACAKGGTGAPTPGATVPTAAPTTTTTNPYAVPPVIDAAYVNRVLAGLDAASGDVLRTVLVTKSITPDVFGRLKSLYADLAQFQVALDIIQAEGRNGFTAYLPNPGNARTVVVDLISSGTVCVFAKVNRDNSAVAKVTDTRFNNQWVAIKHLETTVLSTGSNPTGWAYLYEGFERNLQAPATNPCSRAS